MKRSHFSLHVPVVAAIILAGFSFRSADASSNQKRLLRKCAGLYTGKWIKPKVIKISSGEVIDIFKTAPLMLRLPAGKGRTVSKIDVSREYGDPPPNNTRLISRFMRPQCRRNGKLIIYKGSTTWKLSEAGHGDGNLTGKITARVTKRGSAAVIKRGKIRVSDQGTNSRVIGPIKARK